MTGTGFLVKSYDQGHYFLLLLSLSESCYESHVGEHQPFRSSVISVLQRVLYSLAAIEYSHT